MIVNLKDIFNKLIVDESKLNQLKYLYNKDTSTASNFKFENLDSASFFGKIKDFALDVKEDTNSLTFGPSGNSQITGGEIKSAESGIIENALTKDIFKYYLTDNSSLKADALTKINTFFETLRNFYSVMRERPKLFDPTENNNIKLHNLDDSVKAAILSRVEEIYKFDQLQLPQNESGVYKILQKYRLL